MVNSYLFTSESVSEGHPDKVCDQISDCILDLLIKRDPEARVACETIATTNTVILTGEVRAQIDNNEIEENIRSLIKKIGYDQDKFSYRTVKIKNLLHHQSTDIAQGVDARKNKEEGAGDQGIMFGYACNETDTLMPAPIYYSHRILQSLAQERHSNPNSILEPDAKSQITLEYKNRVPIKAKSVVVSHQHKSGVSQQELKALVIKHLEQVLPQGWMPHEQELYVNPTGRFVIGGPDGDAGLTGRKIIVDTYGGAAPHGGGAFSGKDPTKVDRSAAYIARYIAKNIVAAKLATRCTLQLSYAIGVSKPLSLYINNHNTSQVNEQDIINLIHDLIDLTPRGVREYLQLNKPIYLPTASYGHFGRVPDDNGYFSWEKCDLVEKLQTLL